MALTILTEEYAWGAEVNTHFGYGQVADELDSEYIVRTDHAGIEACKAPLQHRYQEATQSMGLAWYQTQHG